MRYLLFLFVFISSTTLAQNGINYQGAATDSDGAKLVDQNISLRTSVLQGGVDGTTSYSETHNTTTDQFGLFNVVIGQGEVVSGVFDDITWGADAHFLKVELDATGGSDYSLVSTTKMMSVPYALYAESANTGTISVSAFGDTLTINGQSIIVPGISFTNIVPTFGSVTDIDGNTYQTVSYGDAEWMTENLKTTKFNDGSLISQDNTCGQYCNQPAWSYYDNNPSSTQASFGKLYNGWVLDDSRNVCPIGWSIPTQNEWELVLELFGDLDGISSIASGTYIDAGKRIKSDIYWNGSNESYLSLVESGINNSTGSGVNYHHYYTNELTQIIGGDYKMITYISVDSGDHADIHWGPWYFFKAIRCKKD